ncbi:glycosyl transferase, group 2 family protein [Leptolyngbya sp. NIES-3755]|nr:glycosyl transferase, group 2 family protein [Leptolyngbya sp. NIES-3755]
MNPCVSVVIPTYNRPDLVKRAVKSALQQTLKEIEVIVVTDGPDPTTVTELSRIDDTRLRVLSLSKRRGAPVARNTGIEAAQGEWIALLDDDDEWMPEKLERQSKIAAASEHQFPIVSCHLLARTPRGDFVWPRRLPRSGESLGDYLFIRKSLFMGETLILTSTILAPKTLFEKVPFLVGLRKNQDADWLVKADKVPGVGVEFLPDTLAIWYREEKRVSTSTTNDWRHTFDWGKEVRPLLSPQAYAGFVLVSVGSDAYLQGDYRAFFPLLWSAFTLGRPTPAPLLFYLLNWMIPQPARRAVRTLLMKTRST